MAKPVTNDAHHLRELLLSIYVAVLGRIPQTSDDAPMPPVSDAAWSKLATTVLDAAEGRKFKPLKLPWPPTD